MEEFITDERTGLRYELVGDYYLTAGGQTHRHLGTATPAVYPQRCYGDCFKRFDLRITNNRKGCCQQTAAFPLRVVFKKS